MSHNPTDKRRLESVHRLVYSSCEDLRSSLSHPYPPEVLTLALTVAEQEGKITKARMLRAALKRAQSNR